MPRKKKSETTSVVPDLKIGHLGHSPDFESEGAIPMRTPPLLFQDGEMLRRRTILVKKLDSNARLPEKKTTGAAAFDLYALEDTKLIPGQVTKVRTGIAMSIPKGFKGEVYSRSGLALQGVSVNNQPGKIDCDYRGEIIVLLKYDSPTMGEAIVTLRKAMIDFTKNLVSPNQFVLESACKAFRRDVAKIPEIAPYDIKAGDRIAQFEIQDVVPAVFEEVDELDSTERGAGGMGSTGR